MFRVGLDLADNVIDVISGALVRAIFSSSSFSIHLARDTVTRSSSSILILEIPVCQQRSRSRWSLSPSPSAFRAHVLEASHVVERSRGDRHGYLCHCEGTFSVSSPPAFPPYPPTGNNWVSFVTPSSKEATSFRRSRQAVPLYHGIFHPHRGEKSGCDRLFIHLEIHEDNRHTERMDDIEVPQIFASGLYGHYPQAEYAFSIMLRSSDGWCT